MENVGIACYMNGGLIGRKKKSVGYEKQCVLVWFHVNELGWSYVDGVEVEG